MAEDNSYVSISPKILFYIKNKTRVTFRLEKMPEYFFTGVIISIEEDNKKESYRELILKLDNDEEMLFYEDDILGLSIHPASIEPIKTFQRKDIPDDIRKKVFEMCNNVCEIQSDGCTNVATEIDHIIPVSRGGSNELYNLQGSCSNCNKRKSDKL